MLNIEKVKEFLRKIKNLRILVVGDIILDSYLKGKVERISPEAPVPILEVEGEEFRLGGAGNVAKNLSSLGAKTLLCGVIGKDEAGKMLKNLLERNGIESFLVEDDRPTTKKTRIVSLNQQLLRIDWESRKKVEGKVAERLKEFIMEANVNGIIVSDYAKGVITEEVTEVVRNKGIFWSVDPRPVNKHLYRGAFLMTPNEKELMEMMKPLSGGIEELGRKLKEELKLKTLVVTRGAKGMTLFDEGIKHFPARARKVYDVTGAGDTVIATLTAFRLAGASWDEACELANVCAGIVVGEFGTASVKPEQLLEELKLYQEKGTHTD